MLLTLLGILLFLLIIAICAAYVLNRYTGLPFHEPADDEED